VATARERRVTEVVVARDASDPMAMVAAEATALVMAEEATGA
jgi:hypothetical protein